MSDDITQMVVDVFTMVLRQKSAQPPPISVETVLDSRLGLDSLDMAAVIVCIEEKLGRELGARLFERPLTTVGDLVAVCRAVTAP